MTKILFESALCLLAASLLMIVHEGAKVWVYALYKGKDAKWKASPWKFWRYIDPIGLILSLTSSAPISKPFFFRIYDKKTNRILGIAGFLVLIAVYACSMWALRTVYGGLNGLARLEVSSWYQGSLPLFLQYLALMSFGMLCANLFPVSTFDMGLVIAGHSSKAYLNIVKADGIIKLIFLLVLLLGMIRYVGLRVMLWIL